MRYDPQIFGIHEGIDKEKYIIGLYYVETETEDILLRSASIAVEQSTGTWTPVPEETKEIREAHLARVIGVYEVPDYQEIIPKDIKIRRFFVQIAFPAENINGQIPELLTTLYGNISMAGKIRLLDAIFPKSFVRNFKGPKFGIEGVRRLLDIKDRPIVCGMFKPCIGAPPKTLGRLFYEMAMGGIDIIKDDELLADPKVSPVDARLEECLKAADKAFRETGRKVLYALNITDSPKAMYDKAKRAKRAGANCLMVNTYTVGFGALADLAEDPEIDIPLMTHPAMAGNFFLSPDYGISSSLILGKLPRLAGSDMIIYPSPYGKVPLIKERAVRISQELRSPFCQLKDTLPGPAAGIYPGIVPKMMDDFGADIIIGAGGGIHGHPGGARAGVAAFHQAIEAAITGVDLKDAATKHKELHQAIEKWGVHGDKSLYDLTR